MSDQFNPAEARANFHRSFELFDYYMPGLPNTGRRMLAAILQGGICHVLLEGPPGSGKTKSAAIATALIGGEFHKIQCVPDLLPRDIMGSEWYDKSEGWKISWSKLIKANVVAADEINRLDSRTQSVLLEPLNSGECTVQAPHLPEGQGVAQMPKVHVFFFTQNEVGAEGTNPLPQPQYDRFLYRLSPKRISREAERQIARNPRLADPRIVEEVRRKRVLTIAGIEQARLWMQEGIRMHDRFVEHALTLVRATDPDTQEFKKLYDENKDIREILRLVQGAVSIRGFHALLEACRVQAFLFGKSEDNITPRLFTMPEDINALAHDVLDHRLVLDPRAALRREDRGGPVEPRHVIDAILNHIDHTDDVNDYSAYKV